MNAVDILKMYWVILSNLEFPTIFYFIFVITRLSLFVLQWTTFIASCGADSASGNQTLVLLISNVRHCTHYLQLKLLSGKNVRAWDSMDFT